MKVITSHYNADFDSLSSMVAAKRLYPDAILSFPGSQEKGLRNFLINSTLYIFDIVKPKEIDPNAIDTLVLVDTRQRSRIGDFARAADKEGVKIHIYDHHPASEDDIKGDVEVIKTVGATASILVSILKAKGVDITPEEATIMMLGIYEETGSFLFSSTTVEDFEAASYLLSKGANVNLISDLLVKELTHEQVFLLNELITNATIYNINGIDIVITEASTERYVGDIAVIVHKFRDMENINALFAFFRMEERLYIIGRSRIPQVNVGYILSFFNGGGHKEAGSATVKTMTLIEAEERLITILRHNVKPLWKAEDLMFFPVKSVDAITPISEAKDIMVKYNINALPVMDGERVSGIITRQIVEKAEFHRLETLPVKEYMTTDPFTVSPEDSIEKVKEIIIGANQRFLPVIRAGRLVGAITRTDLLRVLEEEITKNVFERLETHEMFEKKKDVRRLMKERLDKKTMKRLIDIGALADAKGYHAYLVGGFVRDLLMRIDNSDIDIVIEGDGIAFAQEFARMNNAKVRLHKEFATAKVIFPDDFKIDVATARLEYYKAPATLPVVEHASLKLDLHRRDFTINTLAISLNKNTFGHLIDFFGAQRDIKEKAIRVIHSLSFVEDPTRVFRAIRFEHRFGFHIGKQTMGLIKNAIKMNFLQRIKGRRLWTELSLILSEEAPERILKRLAELDILRFIHPLLTFDREKERLFNQMEAMYSWYQMLYRERPFDRVLYLLIGLLDNMKKADVDDFCKRLEIPLGFRKRLLNNIAIIKETMIALGRDLQSMKRSAIHRELEPISEEGRLFMMAKTKIEDIKRAILDYITYGDSFNPITTGDDLKRLGIIEGPLFKEVLYKLKEAKIDIGLKTREEEEDFIMSYLATAVGTKR